MQRRDWSYKDGYKPRWIIYCTTAIAPIIVEGAEIKAAGARRALQDHVAVIIPNDQWSPSQQEGEGAAPKEEEAPEGATAEGDPSPQKEGDAAPAATGAEDHRPEWEKEWEAKVVVQTIKYITE